ncbi:calcium-binding protein [Lentibacillus salicampi]|uniref:calcium-binding protein n=1 Tax=Lentibacillus salicampi TaxID=175306 RepID=UPI002476DFBD|nr:calcium-binding protein [Lentibacillus salicampi]
MTKDLTDEFDIGRNWISIIQESVTFPFKAEVGDWQEWGSPVQEGDQVKVHRIDDFYDNLYGLIVNTRLGRKKYHLPLVDLEPIDLSKEQAAVIDDYKVWFSNR